MRKIYNTHELPHLWAYQQTPEARNSSGSLYFSDGTIFSYRDSTALGSFVEGLGLLVVDGTRGSVTTNKHRTMVWEALPPNRKAEALIVPRLDAMMVSDLRRKKGAKVGHDLIRELADSIRDELLKLPTYRNQDKARWRFEKAKGSVRTIKALAEYLKTPAKLLDYQELPEDFPETKEEKLALKTEAFKKQAKALLDKAKENYLGALKRAEDTVESLNADPQFQAGYYFRDAATHLERSWNDYLKAYRGHHGSPLRTHHAERKKVQLLTTPLVEAYHKALDIELDKGFRFNLKRHLLRQRSLRRNGKAVKHPGVLSDFSEAETWARCKPELKPYLDRMKRLSKAWEIRKQFGWKVSQFQAIKEQLQEASGTQWTSPPWLLQQKRELLALEEYIKIIQKHAPWAFKLHPGVSYEKLLPQIREVVSNLGARHESLVSEKKLKWLAGEQVPNPHSLGTLARIVDNSVETTLGAQAPLGHVVRLSKLVRRVLDAGKAVKYDKDRPKVGHFEVFEITEEGAMVIGCHRFEAEEVRRVLGLLENLKEENDVEEKAS